MRSKVTRVLSKMNNLQNEEALLRHTAVQSLEEQLTGLPPDQLALLLSRVGNSIPGFAPKEYIPKSQGGTAEPSHSMPHASATMYTERQFVDKAHARKQYIDAALRTGLKQPAVHDETDPANWKTQYGVQ